MSLSKKYVYVHKCSLAEYTPDNFRKVLGRAWVPSARTGLQYGYDVSPPVMKMTFGPYMEWAHDYFHASEMPATTQIVSIKPNPHYFPPVETGGGLPVLDTGGDNDISITPSPDIQEPCCGWYAYLGAFFADHFSSGNPLQILRSVLQTRVADYKVSLSAGLAKSMDGRYFPGNSCGQTVASVTIGQDTPPTGPTGNDDPLVAADTGAMAMMFNPETGQGSTTQVEARQAQTQTGAQQQSGLSNNSNSDFIPGTDIPAPQGPLQTAPSDQPTGQSVSSRSQVRLFRDLWFQLMTPFSEIEAAKAEGKPKALASDLRFNYNFYLEAYEEQLKGNLLSEIRIPNLYLSVYRDGSVPYVLYLSENIKCRFKEFEKLVLQRGYREYLVPVKQQPWVQDKNIYSTSFPMDATISFGTDRNTFVADALEDSKMECGMLRRTSEGEILLNTSTTPPGPYTKTSQNPDSLLPTD